MSFTKYLTNWLASRSSSGRDPFLDWLKSSVRTLVLVISGVSIPAIAGVVSKYRPVFDWDGLMTTLLTIQMLFILGFLFAIPDPRRDPILAPKATIAVEQFAMTWRRIWFFWLLLYLALTLHELLRTALELGSASGRTETLVLGARIYLTGAPVFLNLLANLTTAAFVVCYFVLSERTVTEEGEEFRPRRLPWDKLTAVVVVWGVIEASVSASYNFGLLNVDWEPAKAFGWITGIVSALAMALVVGKLDNDFIGLRPWTIVALFFYAAIQPGWGAFFAGGDRYLEIVLINIALIMKCLYFAVVAWLLVSGRMLFFLEESRSIYDRAASDREVFLERVSRNLRALPAAKRGVRPRAIPRPPHRRVKKTD